MDDAALTEEFRRICAAATRIDWEADSVTELEPQLVQLLSLARQMTRPVAVQCFVAIIRDEIDAPRWAVPFCMHSLRFPEIQDEARAYVGDPPDPRRMNYFSDIMHAYDDDWQDKDFWSYYQERG